MLPTLTKKHMEVRDHLRMLFQDEGPECAFETASDISELTGFPVEELYEPKMETGILEDLRQHGVVEKMEGRLKDEPEWIASGAEIEIRWS